MSNRKSHASYFSLSLFSLKEFQRLTDRIETLTKARDILAEFLRELKDTATPPTFPYSSSLNDVSSVSQQFHYSPTLSRATRSPSPKKFHRQHTSSISSIHSGTKDPSAADQFLSQRSRSPTLTPSNFIRIHFPNKHTTAVSSSTSFSLRNEKQKLDICYLARTTK